MSAEASIVTVCPVYKNAPDLTAGERLSLASIAENAPAPRILLGPEGLDLDAYPHAAAFEKRAMPPENFDGLAGYNRMMLGRSLYAAFSSFDYMLIVQTDCLILGRDLTSWTRPRFDYVGAPWWGRRGLGRPMPLAVGNGGLSLRRIAGFLDVLSATNGRYALETPFQRRALLHSKQGAAARKAWSAAKAGTIEQGAFGARVAAHFSRGEDEFWSLIAPMLRSGWKTPAPLEALAFSVEHHPRRAQRLMAGARPFGVHAWELHGGELFMTAEERARWSD